MINKVAEFKDRLNQALEDRNIKPVDLAYMTGISESTISQYRSGYAKPKEDKLAKISAALDVNPAWLMGLDVPMETIIIDVESNASVILGKLGLNEPYPDHVKRYVETLLKNHEIQPYIKKITEVPPEYRQLMFESIDRLYHAWSITKDLEKIDSYSTKRGAFQRSASTGPEEKFYGMGRAAKKNTKKAEKIKVRRKKVTE